MLTGDKMETATNIAYACNLLDDEILTKFTFFVSGSKLDEDGLRSPRLQADIQADLRDAYSKMTAWEEKDRPPD